MANVQIRWKETVIPKDQTRLLRLMDAKSNKSFLVDVGKHKRGGAMRCNGSPLGIDDKVYEGVLVGMQAMKARRNGSDYRSSRTLPLDIKRNDQRLFNLPDVLTEDRADCATVVLNGTTCSRKDWSISGNVFNWTSKRKLSKKTDALAIRYLLGDVKPAPVNRRAWNINKSIDNYKKVVGSTDNWFQEVERRLRDAERKQKGFSDQIAQHVGNLAGRVDAVEAEVEDICNEVACVASGVWHLEQAAEKDVEELTLENIAELAKEADDVVEPGRKVWHRLTGEGPWIVVQNTVLNISSYQGAGGDEQRIKQSLVDTAWTVQTDNGLEDYPDVVLTTKKPKKEEKKGWSWPKRIFAFLGVTSVTAAIVHAPMLAKLLGLLQ